MHVCSLGSIGRCLGVRCDTQWIPIAICTRARAIFHFRSLYFSFSTLLFFCLRLDSLRFVHFSSFFFSILRSSFCDRIYSGCAMCTKLAIATQLWTKYNTFDYECCLCKMMNVNFSFVIMPHSATNYTVFATWIIAQSNANIGVRKMNKKNCIRQRNSHDFRPSAFRVTQKMK